MDKTMGATDVLMLGLGGTGVRVLASMRKRRQIQKGADQRGGERYLCVDLYPDLSGAFSGDEFAQIEPRPVTLISDTGIEFLSSVKLDPPEFAKHPGTHMIGRLAYRSNEDQLRQRFDSIRTAADGSIRTILIVASVFGGVGGGTLVPIAALCRDVFGSAARIVGLLALPRVFPASILHGLDTFMVHSNTYATLHELERICATASGAGSVAKPTIFDSVYQITDESVSAPGMQPEAGADIFDWMAAYAAQELLGSGSYVYQAPSDFGEAIRRDLIVVNDELIAYIRAHPTVMYELVPRKFEEVIAAILKGLGYEVMLTKRATDGGKDLYALQHTSVGRHLYIVECKRFAPDRPVGVEIVRSLYGVVQQERATMGVVVTTSHFTRDAIEFRNAVRYNLSLKDYDSLVVWLSEFFDPRNRLTGG